MKYCLLLCLFATALPKAYAGVIDSLSTKEDAQKFLAANFGRKGLVFLTEWSAVSSTEIERIYYKQHSYAYDTAIVEDPVTNTRVIKLIPHEPSLVDTTFYNYTPFNLPLEVVTKLMGDASWHLYKADIDGNGHTDLVIDAAVMLVVMDMGDHLEAHMFSRSSNWNSYSFKKFISLPGGTSALVLRHDHNPWKSWAHSNFQGMVTYITDTFPGKRACPPSTRVDTLYKITTGTVPEQQQLPGDTFKTVESIYADTVDMMLYNMRDTLVYRSCGFTPYKRGFRPEGTSKIYYYQLNSGAISEFEHGCLEIQKDGRCFLQYMRYHETFSAILDSTGLEKLWSFLSSIDIKSKKDTYVSEEESDHGSGATFVFQFDDGTVKKINFWNYQPPLDLAYLSKALSDISKALYWQPSKKRSDFECPCVSPSSTVNDH